MAYEIKENTGSIFKNDYKKDNPKAPDYKGKCNIDGKDLEMAMWLSETKKGTKYFSVRFSEAWEQPEAKKEETKAEEVASDDLPF